MIYHSQLCNWLFASTYISIKKQIKDGTKYLFTILNLNLKKIEDLFKTKCILNKNQCINLHMQLIHVMKEFEKLLNFDYNIEKFKFIFIELYIVVSKNYLLLKNCRNKE